MVAHVKKFALLSIPGLMVLVAAGILFRPTHHLSDLQIRKGIIGTWSQASRPLKVIENKPDGTMVVKVSGTEMSRATWQVANGYVICTPSGPLTNGNPADIESNLVLSLSGNKVVLLSIDGQTALTFFKQ